MARERTHLKTGASAAVTVASAAWVLTNPAGWGLVGLPLFMLGWVVTGFSLLYGRDFWGLYQLE